MSGTSVDGIDAALTEVSGTGYRIKATLVKGVTYPYPNKVRSRILALCDQAPITLAELADLDDAIAQHFIQAIYALEIDLSTVDLIGSHGQTLHHRPPSQSASQSISRSASQSNHKSSYKPSQLGHTLQLGRGDLIAQVTKCPTVSNFRVADIALGGQGAPLVPITDACLLSQPDHDLAVQNIGGIGNVTYLPPWNLAAKNLASEDMAPEDETSKNEKCAAQRPEPSDLNPPTGVIGWDTGPGNALIDWAVTKLSDGLKTYDKNGSWAAQGEPHQDLIDRWLEDPFFQAAPPKSTGRERFGDRYAEQCWQMAQSHGLSAEDFLATLTDFTAATIELSYRQFLPKIPAKTLIGGGGSRNQSLMKCLQRRLPESQVASTDDYRLNADYKEAIAFAILAYWRWHKVPGNLPSVTGASRPCLLGELWRP
jgi:anhydro-N-acetylmuramic acid kinase